MPGKTRNDERNEIIQSQLEHLNSVIVEVKDTVVKLSELVTALQVQDLSVLKREVAVLQFQARRTGATWGAVVGAVISAIVSAMFAILLKK